MKQHLIYFIQAQEAYPLKTKHVLKHHNFLRILKLHRRNVFIFVNKIMMEYMIYVTKTLICRTSERYCGNKNIYT